MSQSRKTCFHDVTGKFITSWALFCHQGTKSRNSKNWTVCLFCSCPALLRSGSGKQLLHKVCVSSGHTWHPAGEEAYSNFASCCLLPGRKWHPLSTASQIEPLPAFPSPGAASGLKKAVFTHFLELCSHFSFNHRDISINVFLKPNYTAGTETVNTTYNQFIKEVTKFCFIKLEATVAGTSGCF